MTATRRCWLMKTEPSSFSIQDLEACRNQTTFWDGVRNYQARNFMREMQVGDRVLFYHSGADPPAVVGTAIVVREAYADHTAQDPGEKHFDPKASAENPIWEMVDIRYESTFDEPLPLDQLRGVSSLSKMELLRKGSRLSVQPVTPSEFETVLKLADAVRDGGRTTTPKRAPGNKSARARSAPRKGK